jgi:hypothetical protein
MGHPACIDTIDQLHRLLRDARELVGRLWTLRWLIPGYDWVFLPSLALLGAGGLLPLGFNMVGVMPWLNATVSCTLLLLGSMLAGPSVNHWLMTGKYRAVNPNIARTATQYTRTNA